MFSGSEYLFTSESVSEGHPDKVCDRISDEILDLFLRHDPEARVAVETLATTNRVVLAGETRSKTPISKEQIEDSVRAAVRDIGYDQEGFSWRKLDIACFIHEQSADIAQGVDARDAQGEGAGDQGLMFGYACRETSTLMPAALHYSHEILRSLSRDWRARPELGVGVDAKSQLTLRYRDGQPVGVDSIVVSLQHREFVSQPRIRELVCRHIEKILPETWRCAEEKCHINPTGRFVIGGPDGDAGLTGRKIIVDTYGGAAPHGGGAFSGKDSTKVDRSAAYAARYLAKNIVAAELAERCLIQLAYAIGDPRPVSVFVHSFGTGQCPDSRLSQAVQSVMDLSPRGIRLHLGLERPIYAVTSSYGHFGRQPRPDGAFSWEKTDLTTALRDAVRL